MSAVPREVEVGVAQPSEGIAATCCGAKTRQGLPCRRWPIAGRRRCRLHGGLSTGPRTPEGKLRSRTARLQHGRRSLWFAAFITEACQAHQRADLDLDVIIAAWKSRRNKALDESDRAHL